MLYCVGWKDVNGTERKSPWRSCYEDVNNYCETLNRDYPEIKHYPIPCNTANPPTSTDSETTTDGSPVQPAPSTKPDEK